MLLNIIRNNILLNPRPFSVFRHLRQWRGGGDPPGVSKVSVVELSGKKKQRIALGEYSQSVVRFLILGQNFETVLSGQRSNFRKIGNFSTLP